MSIYIGAGGIARQASRLYVGVSGQTRPVQKVYVGVDGGARLVYQSGTHISSLGVGSIVKMKVSGVSTNFIIVHQGLPSDAYDSSCNGAWVLAQDVYTTLVFGDNIYYESSNIHTYLNDTFYNLLDATAKSVVKQVNIPYVNKSGVTVSAANGLSTKVFILSGTELNLASSNMVVVGSALEYFKAGNSRIAKMDGNGVAYWTRSPYRGNGVNGFAVNVAGTLSSYGCSGNRGIRPAMVLSADTLVDESGNVIG